MELVLSGTGGKDKIEVSATTFGQEFNESLIHQVLTAFMAGSRKGTKAQKTRGQVRGGGAKPWRQKGTGRARAGTINSPIWRTGGRAFAAVPRDFSQKVNKKMYRAAMKSIISELARQERLVVVNEFAVAEPKTKLLIKELEKHGAENALIVLNEWDSNVYLAARNVPKIDVRLASKVDPASLVKFDKIIVTVAAIRELEGALA